jgi:catechol 2,3-dioxygenase-like lactoylglutathione lyase family enzyme
MFNVLKRATLIVRDAEYSVAFYRDVLGMTVWYDDEIVLPGRGLAAPAAERQRLAIGDLLFVMQADDVGVVCRRLAAWGARVHAASHAFEVRGADGHLVRMTSLSFWDPDGHFFEADQRLAA